MRRRLLLWVLATVALAGSALAQDDTKIRTLLKQFRELGLPDVTKAKLYYLKSKGIQNFRTGPHDGAFDGMVWLLTSTRKDGSNKVRITGHCASAANQYIP